MSAPRVLIVDDAEAFRAVARELVLRRGYAVAGEASCADEAIAMAQRTAPDAVLLDLRLGSDDGFVLAARLTEIHPALAVLITSANSEERFHGLATRHGARGFVSKQDLPRTDLAAFWGPPSLAEEASVLGASDGLGARAGTELPVDAVGLRLHGVG